MKSKYREDDFQNRSSLRAVFIPFMAAVGTLLVVVVALLIREHLLGGDAVRELIDTIKLLVGAGGTGFAAKVTQKFAEMRKQKPVPAQPIPTSPVQKPGVPVYEDPPSIPIPAEQPKPVLMQQKGVVIDRIFENEHKTLGNGGIWDGTRYLFRFKTLELPWRDNKLRISRFPAGTYPAVATRRASNGKYAILLINVPGRSQIMIHIANYVRELLGCIAPGLSFRDLDRDGIIDVKDSGIVMAELEKHFPIDTELTVWVRDCFEESGNVKPNIS